MTLVSYLRAGVSATRSSAHRRCLSALLAVLLAAAATPVSAQLPADTTVRIGPRPPQTAARIDSLRRAAALEAALDTLPVLYTFSAEPQTAWVDADTLVDARFRQVDPARRAGPVDWGTLGNIGGAARPLLFESTPRAGFDAGFHSFDLYRQRAAELRFYRGVRTFSEVYFAQGRTQFDGQVGARFSRTFARGLTLSLDYRNLNHRGQFRYQAARHTSVSAGVWLPVGKRYDGFLTYTTNTVRQQESGGLLSDDIFGNGELSGPIDAPVWLAEERALTRHHDWTVHLAQHLRLAGKREGRSLRASHTAEYGRQFVKFADAPLQADSFFYQGSPFFTDRRGLRQYLEYDRLDNHVALSVFRTRAGNRPSDQLAAGLRHRLIWLRQEPQDSVISNVFATGRLEFAPSPSFGVSARGELGLLDNLGEYNLAGELRLGLGPAGTLRAGLLSQRYVPTLVQHRLFVSQRKVWDNDFAKPVENTLWGSYTLPYVGISLTARAHLVNNFIYFNTDAAPAQTTSPLQVVQFLAQGNFRFGPMHLDNTVAVQRANRDDVLHLPTWFTQNSLYFQGRLFKRRLELTTGFDFRTNSAFLPDAYQPVTTQFFLQDTFTQQPYRWLDAFAAIQIQSFRFVFRFDNVLSLFDDRALLYQTVRYPQYFGSVRFGITWRFNDSNQTAGDPPAATPIPPGAGGPPSVGPRRQ